MQPKPSHALLREYLDYAPETGVLRWRKSPMQKICAGSLAGCPDFEGRRKMRFKGFRANNAVFIWCWMTGVWPTGDVDHRDGEPSNDRWPNLREATKFQNAGNAGLSAANRSGVKGVCWDRHHSAWRAEVRVNGKRHYLGRFASIEEATAVHRSAECRLRGEFRREL